MTPEQKREYDQHMEASRKLWEENRAAGLFVFDGDPHWDAAMKLLADAAVQNAQQAKNG